MEKTYDNDLLPLLVLICFIIASFFNSYETDTNNMTKTEQAYILALNAMKENIKDADDIKFLAYSKDRVTKLEENLYQVSSYYEDSQNKTSFIINIRFNNNGKVSYKIIETKILGGEFPPNIL